jgi:hypothetical protein
MEPDCFWLEYFGEGDAACHAAGLGDYLGCVDPPNEMCSGQELMVRCGVE